MPPQKLDFTLTEEHFADANAMVAKRNASRQPGSQPGEPTFVNARKSTDAAEAEAARNTSSLFDLPNSVRERTVRARNRLRSNLDALRSSGSQYFKDSVPSAPGETVARVLVAVDAGGNVQANEAPKTSLSVNLRPLSYHADQPDKSAFHAAMAQFVAASPLFSKDLGDKVPHAGVHVRLRLRDDVAKADVEGRIQVAVMMTPFRDPTGPVRLETNVVEESDGKKYLDVRVVAVQDMGKDPMEKLIKGMAMKVMRQRGSAVEHASPPDFFRLATLRFDMPASIGEWLEGEKSYMALFEGMRVAFEVVARDKVQKFAFKDLARNMMGSSSDLGGPRAVMAIAAVAAAGINSETDTIVRISPPELVFTQAVRDLGIAVRSLLRDKLEDEQGETVENIEEWLSTTAVEDNLACVMGSYLKFAINGQRAVDLGMGGVTAQMRDRGAGPIDMLLPLKSIIESVDSVHALTHSAELRGEIQGINNRLLRVVPDTGKEIVEKSKAWALANNIEQAEMKEDDADKFPSTLEKFTADGREPEITKSEFKVNPLPSELLKKMYDDYLRKFMELEPKMSRYGPPFPLAMQKPTTYGDGTGVWDWQFPRQMVVPPKRDLRKLVAAMQGGGGDSDDEEEGDEQPKRKASAAAKNSAMPTDVSDAALKKAFVAADEDGSGVLEKGEFFSTVLSYFPTASPSKMVEMWSKYDTNKDGVISYDEFIVLVREIVSVSQQK